MAVKRMMIRFTEEDEAWISEQATDEGVDNATFVRMLVHRLRLGRPALLRTALTPHMVVPKTVAQEPDLRPGVVTFIPHRDDVLTEDEKTALAALDSGEIAPAGDDAPDSLVGPPAPQQGNGAAMSLRKVLPVMHPSNPAYLGSR